MSEIRDYYAITTKKFILRTSHEEWLWKTQKLYNEILYFYYCLFLEHSELHNMGNQKLLRELERLSIVGRDKRPVEHPLPYKKVPLYFRRAAINVALAAGKSFLLRNEQKQPTKNFESGVVFYKGTYKELEDCSICLKVWNGEEWRWLRCRLSGNALPKEAICLSPQLVLNNGRSELHIPIQQHVPDGRTLKERMTKDLKLCSVQFTNRDAIAVCCVVTSSGKLEAV